MLRWDWLLSLPSHSCRRERAELQFAAQQPAFWKRQGIHKSGAWATVRQGELSLVLRFLWCREEGRVV